MPTPVFPTLANSDPGSILRIVIRVYFRDQLGENVYWYYSTAAIPDLTAMVNAWETLANTFYLPLLNEGAFIRDAYVQWQGVNGWSQSIFSGFDGEGGTVMGLPMPTQVSGIITRRIIATGPSNRGRLYIPFASVADQGGDEHPSLDYQSRLENLATALMPLTVPLALPDGSSLIPILWNYANPFGTPEALFEWTAQDKWATQKRRGDYGKMNS